MGSLAEPQESSRMADSAAKKVVIVGGSIGGLMTGIIFVRLGHNVTILERTRATTLRDRGAGISLMSIVPQIREAFRKLETSGAPIVDFLDQYDRTKTPTLECEGFQFLNKDGSIHMQGGAAFRVTSWDLLYNVLRANYDGEFEGSYISAAEKMSGDGKAEYLTGTSVINLQASGDVVTVEYETMDGKCSMDANIVVAADGPSSTVRKLLLPEIERKYVGYALWRGTVQENLLTDETRNFLGLKGTISYSKGSMGVVYKIPGFHGSLVPGEILANLGWYQNYNEDELKKILTDSEGITHQHSLGVGKMDSILKQEQRDKVAAILPPQLAEVFQKIESPFIQAITDNLTTKSVFMNGKVFLVGDAVAGIRPQTGAGTAQVAMHAFLLKKLFEAEGGMSVEEWEKATLELATMVHDLGVQTGNLAQFGDHPMADNGN